MWVHWLECHVKCRNCVCTLAFLGSATDLYFAQSNNKLLVSVGQDSRIHFLDIHQRKSVCVVQWGEVYLC